MTRGTKPYPWATLTPGNLMNWRLCDLGLTISGSPLPPRVAQLHAEMRAAGLRRFRPRVWLGDEWFSPDGVPGIAMPFYLAHPRLARLERRQMGDVEGGTRRECMKILRHEAGHAVCTAYRLHRRKRWRELFGRFDEPYPETYKPRPASREYVHHLDRWYAQAHPAEDWAETFAVWMTPGASSGGGGRGGGGGAGVGAGVGGWRRRYRDWPALEKLEYVDELMRELGDDSPPVPTGAEVDTLADATETLAEHYQKRREHYGTDYPDVIDADLRTIFVQNEDSPTRGEPAASYLRRSRAELRRHVARWAGTEPYNVDQVLLDMIGRSRQLGLRVRPGEGEEAATRRDVTLMVMAGVMRCVLRGHARVAV